MYPWFMKYHDQGPNIMVDPPTPYIEIIQSHKEPPMRLLFIHMNMGDE